MKVLVLGDSDSLGVHTGGQSWPHMLEASLSERLETPAEVVSVSFSALQSTAHEYAERKVSESAPDSVVLLLGSFPFTAGFTWLRVQQLFGKRAGAKYRAWEERFDVRTRDDSGKPERLNRIARTVIRRVIGTKTFSTREQISDHYRAVFRALSRFEDTQVVIFAYAGLGRHAREGKGPALRKVFFADMRAAADEARFGWIDGVGVFAGHTLEELKIDDLHLGPAGHQLIARAVEAALAPEATARG